MSAIIDNPKTVYRRALGFYAFTTLPASALGVLFANFYFIYATDVLLLAPAVVGTLLALARVYDGVSDIAIAAWSDRAESRHGRRRPFILAGGLICVLLPMLWLVPSGMGPLATAAWVLVALIAVQTAFTLRTIPLSAIGIEAGETAQRRTLYGIVIPFLAVPAAIGMNFVGQGIIESADPVAVVTPWAVGLSALVVILTLAAIPFLKELPARHASVERNVWGMIKEVLGVGYHRQLIGVQFAESFAFTSLAFSVPYMLSYVIGRPDMIAAIFVTYLVVQRVASFGWYRMIPRWGMRDIWSKGLKLWALVFVGVPFTLWGGLPLYLALTVLAGVAGGAAAVNFAMLGDVSDYDAKLSGRQRQGIYMTIYRLVGNIGGAATGFALGWLLQLAGYVPNGEQSATTITAIVASSSLLPIIGVGIGVALLARYRLYEREGMSDGRESVQPSAASSRGVGSASVA